MIEFKLVEVENFLSFKKFQLPLSKQGLVLIEGRNLTNSAFISNGTGKTASLSAVTYAIYGKTEKGQTADEVVNNKVGKNTKVTLHFDVDNEPYRIDRYRGHSKFKNTVKLFHKDEEIKTKSVKDTNNRILELFGIDYDTYVNAVAIGQGSNISFSEATDKQKKEILENVANIAIYGKAQEVAKAKLSEVETNLTDMVTRVREVEQDIDHKRSMEQVEQDRYNALLDRYNYAKGLLEEAKRTYDDLLANDNTQDLNIKLQQVKEELSVESGKTEDTAPDTTEQEDQISKWREAVNNFKGEVQGNNFSINNLTNQLNAFDTSTVCPTCGSPLDPTHALQEQEKVKGQITQLQNRNNDLNATIGKVEPLINAKEKEIADIRSNYQLAREKSLQTYYDLQREQARLEQDLRNTQDNITRAKQNLDQQEQGLQSYQEPEKPKDYAKDISQLEETIESYKKTIDKIQDDIVEYKQVVEMYSNKGIRSVVLDTITPYLNERANHYLAKLAGSSIQINLSTQKENKDGTMSDKFEVEVYNNSGGADYKSASAGERKRIDIAISFALQDLVINQSNTSLNLLMLDEVFENLDEVANENVVSLLKEKAKTVESIFVITHNEQLKGLFENKITITKQPNGISEIDG